MKKQTQIVAARHAATKATARQATAAMDAVPVLKRHFALVLGHEKITQEQASAFAAASVAVVKSEKALALLGGGLVQMLIEHYMQQLDQLAQQATPKE